MDVMSDAQLAQLAADSTAENVEAWVAQAREGQDIQLGELDTATSLAFLERLFTFSPRRVVALEPEHDPQLGVTTNTLIIELPASRPDRAGIFALEGDVAATGGFDPEADRGQRFLMFHW